METRIDMKVSDIFANLLERDLAVRTVSYHLRHSGLYNVAQMNYILGRGLNNLLTLFKWEEYVEARSLLTTPSALEVYIKLKYALPAYLNKISIKPPASIRNSVVLP